ncbi:hypothetical protein [Halococcus hamelinensis]|uniref:Uncharacterized protein n=1 Tax=Halococcus hamelinensis 100A6 TaxID=1132509 RepID=M0M5G8_9EURY|nr:hypothetical protein [Halococcus hamelinensis]EMA40951.1 hypothetical protein C447_02969 [Halococcus hamelinensis 100A6]
MDTLRLVGGAVVAYLGFVFLLGTATVLPSRLDDLASFAVANATEPVVVLNAALPASTLVIVALARRSR